MSSTQTHQNPFCPICACKLTVKKGVRRNRLQTLQVFRCTECLHRFTGAAGKNKTYPLHVILESVSTFNLGYSLTETQRVMRRRYHREIPERTLSFWLSEYRLLSTYSRLRLAARRFFRPDTIIRSHTFHHQQVYRFQVHQAKLEFLTQKTALPAAHPFADIASLKKYLESIETHFPHHFFQTIGLLEIPRRPSPADNQEGKSCYPCRRSCAKGIQDTIEVALPDKYATVPVAADSFFSVQDAQGRTHYFLEADRGTMTLERFTRKLIAYAAYDKAERQKNKFGIRRFRVLTVTTGQARMQNLMRAATGAEEVRKAPASMFLFTTEGKLTPSCSETILEKIWLRLGEKEPCSLGLVRKSQMKGEHHDAAKPQRPN